MKRGLLLAWGVGIWACGSSGGGEAVTSPDAGADATVITGTPSAAKFSIDAPAEPVTLVRGGSIAVPLKIARDSVGDAIKVAVSGLPQGVVATELVFAAADTTASLVLTASADAVQQGEAKITLTGTAEDAAKSTGTGTFALFVRGRAGDVDTTFGQQGQVIRPFNGPDSLLPMVLGVDASDRLYLVALCLRQGNASLCASRLAADGKLDPTFGTAGFYEKAPFGVFGADVYPDGRSIVTGYGTGSGVIVMRLDANGVPDATFGNGAEGPGVVRVTHPSGTTGTGFLAARRPAGGLVLGYQRTDGNTTLGLAALKEDGSVDTTVFNQGYSSAQWGTGDLYPSGLVVRANGHVAAAGVQGSGASATWGAFQLKTDGNYDAQFNGTGQVSSPYANADTFVGYGAVLLSDGSVVFAVSKNADATGTLVRLKPNGAPDDGFATGGAITLTEPALGIARQPDDKIVIALGTKKVQRFLAGQVDGTFGTAGVSTVSPTATGGRARVALQKDGRIVHMVAGPSGMVVTRLWQ